MSIFGISSDSARPRRNYLLLALPALIIALFAIPATASAAKPFFVSVPKIKASKGYTGSIFASGGGPMKYASLQVRKGGGNATYDSLGKVKVTSKKVVFALGARGKVTLTVKSAAKPKSIPVPKRCTGKAGKRINVVYKGSVKLTGEDNFTKINAKKLKGTISFMPQIKSCKPGGGGGGPKPKQHAYFSINSSVETDDGSFFTYVSAARRTVANAKTNVYANIFESHTGYVVFRNVYIANRPASALAYNSPYTTSTLTPGSSSFSGSATLVGESGTPTGNLVVNYPGRPGVEVITPGAEAWFSIQSGMPVADSKEPATAASLAERFKLPAVFGQ